MKTSDQIGIKTGEVFYNPPENAFSQTFCHGLSFETSPIEGLFIEINLYKKEWLL